MKDEKKTGGPAFPRADIKFHVDGYTKADCYGMTLRDYFAGQALPILIKDYTTGDGKVEFAVAKTAYEYADAMLKERGKDGI